MNYENMQLEMDVVTQQPVLAKTFAPQPLISYPERASRTSGGLFSMLGACIVGICIIIFFFPFGCIGFMFYPCCSLKGRGKFLGILRSCFKQCCCRCDCVSPLTLYQAMLRYEEDPLMSSQDLITSVRKNKFMIAILETLTMQLPSFFFTFLPSGSLREKFGKLLPSSSVLASDYDIMLVPDAVIVGENGVSGESPSPVFRALRAPKEHSEGYLWLKLEDKYLLQWEKHCLRRHIDGEGCSLLSSTNIHEVISHVLSNSKEIASAVEQRYCALGKDTRVALERSGPAMTLKIGTLTKNKLMLCGCTCSSEVRERLLFHADFTLALHCSYWPSEALGFFDNNRRRNWPPEAAVNTIRRLGIHVVPKQSTNELVKLTLEQAEYTTYGRSPGLEWRYSFSQAEIILSDHIPHQARTAYLAFKAINKRHLNRKGRPMGSYVLKCILLSVVEEKRIEFWEENNEEITTEVLMDMLNRLKDYFEQQRCPNYWLPNACLFAGSLSGSDIIRKERLLAEILESPKKYIADQWLEYTRCLRVKCCYCGSSGWIPQFIESGEVGDMPIEHANFCCSCNYKYKDSGPLCGGACDAGQDMMVY